MTGAPNTQHVGVQGDSIVVLHPRMRMTRWEALNHAAWLVTLADPDGTHWPDVLDALRSA